MAGEEKSNTQLDLDSLSKTDQLSEEDKNELIKSLKRELEEELIVTSSLTHVVAEKTAEIEHLQTKVSEQETRIFNLEDQVEEWTTQADSCDKLLEQKDCEIELLQKTLKIEKQQRRDLEDATMEMGKESILEKEALEATIASLQEQLQQMAKTKASKGSELKHDSEEDRDVVDAPIPDKDNCDGTTMGKEAANVLDMEEERRPDIKKEEYKADMEVLMNDLFDLIKQNEELKEEITEQCSMVENSRSVVKELKTTITEKAAEIQQQKHEIRRLSLAVETGESDSGMQSDFDRYKQVNQIREETQNRLDDLESINSELRARLDEYGATQDSLKNQYNKMKQKLELEREQNAELNRQLLEVSDLYDMYYTKCGELEKGRIKGIDNPLGGQQIEGDAIQRSLGDLILTQEDLGHAGKEDMLTSQGSEESMETRSGDDVKSEHASSSKIDSSKKKSKSEIQPSSQSDTRLQSKDESVLMAIVNLTKLLFLVTATFIIVTTLRIYYGFSVGQILSTVFATYVFLYNLWRILSKREQSGNDRDESKNGMQKLRRAMQDLILRLDERNFKEFREIYESFIVQSFDEQEINRSRNLEVEIQYLISSKDALSRELARYKEMNKPQISDYNQLKREIDVLRIKRIEEDEVSQRIIQSLKDDIKAMEVHLSAKVDVIDDGDILNRFMQGSLLKLLLFAVLEGLLLMSVSSSFLLIPASFLSLVLLALMYKTDLNLRYTSNENRGYQKTIKELLRKVNDYREEGKQISDEVRELEAMVDKDYHIISKQRHAIERLERQLQRAINKYREKKRTLERFVWLQEKNISDFVGLDDSEASKHSGVDVLFSKKSHSDIEHEDKSTWIWFCFKILLVALIAYAAVTRYQIYGLPLSYSDIDPFYLAGALTCVGLIFIFAKHRFWQRSMLQRTSLKAQLQETREDEKILVEQIDVLRSLLSNEREIVAKLEKQIEDVKELPGRKIPKEEVNAVIDRLIEVSKHRDELVMTASSAKDKYDHIKKTLEDILSREKYLSEEVSSLRTQKRELQNDLMKEQLKNIDMYEEVKKAKNDSNKEEGIAQKSETEWDFYIDDFIKNSTGTEGGMPLESELVLESDSVIESLEHAGSYAQKNRKKRSLKRRQKQQEQSSKDVVNGEQMLQTLQDDEADSGDKEERDKKKDITEEESESIAVNEVESNLELVKNGEKQVEHLQQLSADDVRIFDRHSDQGARNEERSTESIEKPIDSVDFFNRNREIIGVPGPVNDLSKFDKNENSLLKKIIAQAKLLDAKDWELDHLKYLLEASNLNISRENSDSGTDCEKKFNDSNMKDCQQEIRKLANEVFSLADLCSKGEVHVNAVELEEVTSRPEDFFNYLTEHVLLTKYKLSADKADMVAKVSAMEEEVEEARQKIEKLHAEVAKEKQTRSHLISEYEKEYERLESCLGDAYEKVRKSLLEERSLRGEIMNQYEDEIEDIQTKTAEVLKGLQDQLKKERKEKEKAQTQVEGMGKRIKELEVELNAIEEVEKSNQVYVNLQDLRLEANEGEQGKMQQSHTVTLKGLAEEEAYKRTRVLKEKLNEAEQSIDEYRIKLNEKDLIIGRFEKHEKDLRVKMDTQSKRMKDLENEIRSPAIVKDGNAWTVLRESKPGFIHNVATKNGSSKWENPSYMGIIQVTRSSAGFGNASDVLDEKPMPCSTDNLEDSWFQLDFGQDNSFLPSSYSFCHGWLSSDGCARNWVFEGSLDGTKWHILRQHVMDRSLNNRFMAGSWKVLENKSSFRYLRIRMTGPNSSNTNELYIGGLEVYGKIINKY